MEKQKFILIQFLLVLNVFANIDKVSADEDSFSCSNPNGKSGKCVRINECPALLVIKVTRDKSAVYFLKKSQCNPNTRCLKNCVCCTTDTNFSSQNNLTTGGSDIESSLDPTTAVYDSYSCSNPNGKSGKCVRINECPALLVIKVTRDKSAVDFLKNSQCNTNTRCLKNCVCCTTDTNFSSQNNLTTGGSDIESSLVPTTAVYDSYSCSNPNGNSGKCVTVKKCSSLMNAIKTRQTSVFEFVRQSKCDPNGRCIKNCVCCTTDTNFSKENNLTTGDSDIDSSLVPTSAANDSSSCNNPNGNSGKCVHFKNCPSILNTIKTGNYSTYEFARQSECKPNRRCLNNCVCCNSDTGFSITNDSSERLVFDDNSSKDSLLFPSTPVCGPSFVRLMMSGVEPAFPWSALLEYKKPKGSLVFGCSGNIINHRYILTAAHCVKGEEKIRYGKLVSVSVGAQNMITPTDLSPTSQRLKVVEFLVHPDYKRRSPSKPYRQNDIALVRTEKSIQYTPLVAPVCLPTPFPDQPELKNAGNCNIEETQEEFCAGFNQDCYSKYSGGGLVRWVKDAWTLEGVFSGGHKWSVLPGTNARVSCYISWIHAIARA